MKNQTTAIADKNFLTVETVVSAVILVGLLLTVLTLIQG